MVGFIGLIYFLIDVVKKLIKVCLLYIGWFFFCLNLLSNIIGFLFGGVDGLRFFIFGRRFLKFRLYFVGSFCLGFIDFLFRVLKVFC